MLYSTAVLSAIGCLFPSFYNLSAVVCALVFVATTLICHNLMSKIQRNIMSFIERGDYSAKYIIHSISLTAFSIILIALITLYGNFELDISGIKVENIDIVEVFVHNFFTMILSTVAGIFTAGFYSVGVLGIDIFNIGTLSNELYVQGMSNFDSKISPSRNN